MKGFMFNTMTDGHTDARDQVCALQEKVSR